MPFQAFRACPRLWPMSDATEARPVEPQKWESVVESKATNRHKVDGTTTNVAITLTCDSLGQGPALRMDRFRDTLGRTSCPGFDFASL